MAHDPPLIHTDDALTPHCRLGEVVLRGIRVREGDDELTMEMRDAAGDVRSRYANSAPGDIDRVRAVRAMYRALGVDPHHTRPSSEALFRRVLRGEQLPRVNTVVDAANLWSLERLCPVGLYDLDRVEPPVAFRLGAEGDGYEGIRKDWVNVSHRPVLVDNTGPFGNPTSDSRRTAVTGTTRNLLAVAFQPPDFPTAEVAALEDVLRRYNIAEWDA